MTTYTAFCCDVNGGGTIWIDSVECNEGDLETAKRLAVEKCGDDWHCECPEKEIHVLGLVKGEIEVAYWSDIAD